MQQPCLVLHNLRMDGESDVRDAGMLFEDREDAGRRLTGLLERYANERPVVFALPRGGVPVGAEVSRSLGAPLEVIVSRKLGAPGQPEFGIGAVAPGGVRILNERVVRALGIPEDYLDWVSKRESEEADRRLRLFRGDRPYPDLKERTAILVDDGLATGVTARAALLALRRLNPRRLVLAVPVCAPQTAKLMRAEADDLICLLMPDDLEAVGLWYRNFEQVPDEEVVRLLKEAQGPARADSAEEGTGGPAER
jgi:putative phosphoribosyl transferase